MRTIHLINGLGTGGAERSLAEIVRRFPALGIQPTVVCLNRRQEGVEAQVIAAGVDVRFLEAAKFIPRVRELRTVLWSVKPTVLHTTIFEADVLGRLAAIRSTPVLTSLVNTSYGPERLADPNVKPHRLRAVQALDALTAHALTARFHAITEAVKAAAMRDLRLNEAKISVVPRGRDPQRLGLRSVTRRASVRAALGIDSQTQVVLNVGRQEFQKGQVHLLRAASAVAQQRNDVVWLIAGREGNASKQLRDEHDLLELGDRVRFLGHRDDVPDLLAAADIFVFPSLYEGLGGAAIEAMALEAPIIAADVPALREVLDDGSCGVLVPPADPTQLAGAVLSVLDDEPRRRELAAQALQRFHERYTVDQMVGGMADLLRLTAESS